MSEYEASTSGLDAEDQLEETINQDKNDFKQNDYLQKDFFLSLVLFGPILFLPLLVWEHINHTYIFIWQGCMVSLTLMRWVNRYTSSDATTIGNGKNIATSLTLLDGLGWGLACALILPIDSNFITTLTMLFVVGVSAAAASLFSAKLRLSYAYITALTLPLAIHLLSSNDTHLQLLACVVVIMSALSCLVALLQNKTLYNALDDDNKNKAMLDALEENNIQLKNNMERVERHRLSAQDELERNAQELAEMHELIEECNSELSQLGNNTVNLLNDVNSLKQSPLNKLQSTLLNSIEETTLYLAHKLDSSDAEETDHDFDPYTSIHPGRHSTPKLHQHSNLKRGLIVNDDGSDQDKIHACLNYSLVDFDIADNIPSALNRLCQAEANQSVFDLIILNASASNTSENECLEFVQCLKEDSSLQHIEFIFIASEESSIQKEQLDDLAIKTFIKKPFHSEELVTEIFQLVSHNQSIPANPSLGLPAEIESLVNDTIEISSYDAETNDSAPIQILDEYIIEGLLSTSAIDFSQLINDFLEDMPILIEAAKLAFQKDDYDEARQNIRELGSRSLHMGSITILEQSKAIEADLTMGETDHYLERLNTISLEFLKVESLLLDLLTDDTQYLSDSYPK